ncbi:MAG TPA: SDR family NAD(P)-dependent oxidoreductase, partial [Enterococcus sp.]|nr:SDR family NAD(P)-dependent oxidoreductase [Enterococcus sp.]
MKTILITGASSGIGQAVVERFAAQDVCLLLVGRNQEKLQQLAQKLPGENQLIPLDLTDLAAVQKIPARYKIDCLINCAGVGEVGDFQELSLAQELAEIETNFLAP